jgi:hypothetical protein
MQGYTVYLYLETALRVLGGTSTHHQERIQLYLQHLVFVTPLCYLPLSSKSWNRFECAVGGVSHPQHVTLYFILRYIQLRWVALDWIAWVRLGWIRLGSVRLGYVRLG